MDILKLKDRTQNEKLCTLEGYLCDTSIYLLQQKIYLCTAHNKIIEFNVLIYFLLHIVLLHYSFVQQSYNVVVVLSFIIKYCTHLYAEYNKNAI